MTYMELATYLAMANVLMKEAEDTDDTDIISKIREALCESQMYFTNKAITEIVKK